MVLLQGGRTLDRCEAGEAYLRYIVSCRHSSRNWAPNFILSRGPASVTPPVTPRRIPIRRLNARVGSSFSVVQLALNGYLQPEMGL